LGAKRACPAPGGRTHSYAASVTTTPTHAALSLPRPVSSLLRPLQAFEESLTAHSNELELKKGLLQKVTKSREDELTALSRMQGDVKRQL
jgi:hypothetical protein